jgi:hypothetical protein
MRFFIYAQEKVYGGDHGIYDFDIVHADSMEDANLIGRDMAINLIETNDALMNIFEAKADLVGPEDSQEWNEALDEAIENDAKWEVYEIDEEAAHDVSDFILSVRFMGDVEEFVDNYCKKPDEKN